MMTQDFLKKIEQVKRKYQALNEEASLRLQTILRKDIQNSDLAIFIAEVLLNEKKYKNKFPQLIQSGGLLKGEVCEQATDEQVAEHKAHFFSGFHFLDLTAGLGIDTMAFAKQFHQVTAVEANSELIPILEFNISKLKITNIHFTHNTAENFLLSNSSKYDLVYIDPSRKIGAQKVYHPKDCVPNIFELLPQLYLITQKILIKLSPMVEVVELTKWFQNIEWIWIISKNHECKEVLVLINTEYNQMPKWRLSILQPHDSFVYELNLTEKLKYEKLNVSLSEFQWILIPDVTFTKSHALNYLQKLTNGYLTNPHDGVLLLTQKVQPYYGKQKRILHLMNLKKWEYYQKEKQLYKAQVIKKHFPLKVEEIRKKWKISDGNKDTLIFLKIDNQNYVIHCIND